jgi:hypothetical protein
MVNVMGDTYGAGVIESTSEKELHKLTMKAKRLEEQAAANGEIEAASP